MYIDANLSSARLPARTPDTRFRARALASSAVFHVAMAVGLLLLAHRAMPPAPPETPPIPMIFLPPEPPPAPLPPPEAAPVQTEPEPPPPPEPAPVPQPAPPPPPPLIKEQPAPRPPPAPRKMAARKPIEHREAVVQPLMRETVPERPPAPTAAEPLIAPRPLSEAAGNRQPDYPDSAQRRGEQGSVLLRVDVSADGRAESVRLLKGSGFERLDQSAMSAVRGWRFIPATRGGKAVPGVAEVPVNFRLSG